MQRPQDKYRVFFALPLPDDLRDRLGAQTSEWRRELRFDKWVHPSDMHITVVFVGDADVPRIDRMTDTVSEAIRGYGRIDLNVAGLGTFGPPSTPRIFWAGVAGDRDRLDGLYQATANALIPLGVAKESRPYRPHITLARRGQAVAGGLPPMLKDEPLVWTSKELVLYRTHMGRTPMYEAIHSIPFGK